MRGLIGRCVQLYDFANEELAAVAVAVACFAPVVDKHAVAVAAVAYSAAAVEAFDPAVPELTGQAFERLVVSVAAEDSGLVVEDWDSEVVAAAWHAFVVRLSGQLVEVL